MSKAGIDKETFHIPCKIFGCNNRAEYRIGNLTGSPGAFFHVCGDCLQGIVDTVPEDMKPIKVVEKEVIKEVEKEVIKEVEIEKVVEVVKDPTLAEAKAIVDVAEQKAEAKAKAKRGAK